MIDEAQKDDPEVAKTVRALYVISPDKKLRLSMIYPMSTGRNVEWVNAVDVFELVFYMFMNYFSEILRVIDSLQLTDRLPQVATPANWVVSIFWFV